MSLLEHTACAVEQLQGENYLSLSSTATLNLQLENLTRSHQQLLEIKAEFQPYVEKIAAKIVELNALCVAKAGVGIALMVFGGEVEGAESWFTDFLGSFISELGENFLSEAIHNDDELRKVNQICQNIWQNLLTQIEINATLQEIAKGCLTDTTLSNLIDRPTAATTPDGITAQYDDYVTQIQFYFDWGEKVDFKQKLTAVKQAIAQIQKLEQTLIGLQQKVENNLDLSTIHSLLKIFGSTVTHIQYNSSGEWAIGLENQEMSCQEIKSYCDRLLAEIHIFIPKARHFHQLTQQCCQASKLREYWQNTQGGCNLEQCQDRVNSAVESLPQTLQLGGLELLKNQWDNFKLKQGKVKQLYQKIKEAIPHNSQNNQLALSPKNIWALSLLFGQFLQGMGFDRELDLVFYQTHSQQKVQDILAVLEKFIEQLHQPLTQSFSLRQILENCSKTPQLLQLYQSQPPKIGLPEFEAEIKGKAKIINQPFNFTKLKQMREKVKQDEEILTSLETYQKHLHKLTYSQNPETGLTINAVSLKAYILLFGLVDTLSFDNDNDLVLTQGLNQVKSKTLQKNCLEFQKTIVQTIEKGNQALTIANRCFDDKAFRQEMIKTQRRNALILKTAIASGIVMVLTPFGLLGWNIAQANRLQTEAAHLFAQVNPIETLQTPAELQTAYQTMSDAIALLEKVPSTPGTNNQQTQENLTQYRQKYNAIALKIQTEETSISQLEEAKTFAKQAGIMVQNAPHPLAVWQDAAHHWQQAIDLLQSVSEEVSITAEIDQKITDYEANLAAIEKRIKLEEIAIAHQEKAAEIGQTVNNLLKETIITLEIWQTAATQCQESVALLQAISPHTYGYTQVQQDLQIYQTQCSVLTNIQKAGILMVKASEASRQTPHTVNSLQQILNDLKQANELLKTAANYPSIAESAYTLQELCAENYEQTQEKQQKVQACTTSSCFDAIMPLSLRSPR